MGASASSLSRPVSVALVTAANMSMPDPESHLVVAALADLGVRAEILAWSEPHDWASIPLVVLRSPWDYFRRLDEFLDWAEGVDAKTRLLNPFAVVRWNAHKGYLHDLERQAISVVPTTLLPKGYVAPLRQRGDLVAKPAVSAGAHGTVRGRTEEPAFVAQVEALLQAGDVLLQPFVPGIEDLGEVSLVYLDGVFSHAVRKVPARGEFRVQEQFGGTVHAHVPTARELETAEAALAVAPGRTLYARVDLVSWEGVPAVMELEVIEPFLFLANGAGAAVRLAKAIAARLS